MRDRLIPTIQSNLFQSKFIFMSKLYIPSTLNIDLILWQSWVIHFTFQAYTLPHTLNCICVLIQISYLNLRVVLELPKMARSAQTHKGISFI